ncbi:MAG: carboxypeptidase-like regulatory domain-containing protein [Terracidiphilus sp.]
MTDFKRVLLTWLILMAGLGAGLGQTSNGTIIGTVTDSSGAAIVGATITVVSKETGAERKMVSGPDGAYRIESLLPGTYKVSGTAKGFAATNVEGVIVPSSSIVTASLQLKVGSAADQVEVSADNSLINTDNGQLSGTIDEQEVQSLPINSESPYELALTLPGVTSPPGYYSFTNGVGFGVGGGRPRSNDFLIEGQDNNDAGITGQGLQPDNIEADKEVTILENSYTAEYGHGGGSVSNLIFKSGTNQFHGSVYERAQNSSLDTVDKEDHFFDSTPTLYRENQPGFTFGGPIKRDKIFFFASYALDNYRASANLTPLAIPDAAGLATLKALPSNPYLNNLLTAYGPLVGIDNPNDPQPSIPLGPDPATGIDRGTVTVGLVRRNLGASTNNPELDLKGDYIAGPKDTLSLHMIRNSFLAPFDVFNAPAQLPGFDSDQNGISYNSGIVETHVFSPKVVNDFRASYGRIGFTFGLPGTTLANPLYNQPAVSITNLNGYGIPGGIPQGRFHDTYQAQDSVSWTKGKHFLKIGADIADIKVEDQVPFNFFGAISYADDATPTTLANGETVTYTGLANLIDDFSGSGLINAAPSTVTQDFGSPTSRPQLISQNYFVQDTYRVLPNVSVDFGMRYEYNGAPFNAPGTPFPAISLNNLACNPLVAGSNCPTRQQSDFTEWGPRMGIVFSPTIVGQYKTVFRGGFGVFYDVLFTNIIDNIQATFPNAASDQVNANDTLSRGTSGWAETFATLDHIANPAGISEPIVNNLQLPRTFHWNFNIEQELPWSSSLNVSYVGERGDHLYGNEVPNQYINDYLSGARVLPGQGEIEVRDNSGQSNYNGLWTEFDHKFNHSFLFRASYTFARSQDDTSEIFSGGSESSLSTFRYPAPRRESEYGLSAYDHRQRLVLAYVWSPAVWHTEGAMKVASDVVNHWQVAGITQFQSGSPENVEVGLDVNGDGIGNDRPVVSNPKAPLATYAVDDSWFNGPGNSTGTLCSGPSFYYTNNPCQPVAASSVHWVVPAIGTQALNEVGRNSLIGPGFQQWDMNISRTIPLHDRFNLDVKGEFFNIFNHGEGAVENTTLGTGIVTDQFENNGVNNFANLAPTVTGHRHVRIFIKFSF